MRGSMIELSSLVERICVGALCSFAWAFFSSTAVADAGRLMLLKLLRPLASAAERSDFVATSGACDASVLDAELLAAAGLLTFDS